MLSHFPVLGVALPSPTVTGIGQSLETQGVGTESPVSEVGVGYFEQDILLLENLTKALVVLQ